MRELVHHFSMQDMVKVSSVRAPAMTLSSSVSLSQVVCLWWCSGGSIVMVVSGTEYTQRSVRKSDLYRTTMFYSNFSFSKRKAWNTNAFPCLCGDRILLLGVFHWLLSPLMGLEKFSSRVSKALFDWVSSSFISSSRVKRLQRRVKHAPLKCFILRTFQCKWCLKSPNAVKRYVLNFIKVLANRKLVMWLAQHEILKFSCVHESCAFHVSALPSSGSYCEVTWRVDH